jgi:hypothetical protein
MSNYLIAHVEAVNFCHLLAMRLEQVLKVFFTPYVGKKVIKIDGTLMQKIADEVRPCIEPIDEMNGVQVYFDRMGSYSLRWTVKVCKHIEGAGSCLYYEHSVYVGDLEGQTLKNIKPTKLDLRTDFTAAEIESKRKVYKQLQETADQAKGQLYPFGEYDRH